MSRPRRSTALKTYTKQPSEEEIEVQLEGSDFDSLSEESTLSDESNGDISESGGSGSTPLNASPELPDNTNVFPTILTEPQMVVTRAIVTEQTIALAQLNAAREEHLTAAQALESSIKKTETSIFKNKAKLSTLNRIPPEILGVIFVSHVQDNAQSPWLLMQVSRAWRATALLTRVLWRGIMLIPQIKSVGWTPEVPGAIRRTSHGKEICTNESLVLSALSRAGSCPLDLEIKVSSMRRSGILKREEAKLLELIQVIIKNQTRPRIRSLKVSTAGQFTFPIDTFNQFSFAEAEFVSFDYNYHTVLRRLVYEAPFLHILHITATSIDFLRDFSRWDQIAELSVKGDGESMGTDIGLALREGAKITKLTLVGDLLGPSNHSSCDTPKLPSLTHLFFQCTSNIFSIKYPNLTHLNISYLPEWTGPSPQDDSVVLPHLVEVECTHWEGCIGILRAIHAPSLRNLILALSVTKAANARGFKRIWPPQSAVAREKSPSGFLPISLHLTMVWISTKAWGRMFAEQTALEECHIIGGDFSSSFFEALAPVKVARVKGTKGRGGNGPVKTGWKVECPRLKRMVLDCSGSSPPDQTLKGSARVFVAQRLEAGAPLEQLAIRLSGEDWEELVE